MNKLYISILALATLSGAAYANGRDYATQYPDTYNVKKSFTSSTMTKVSPLAVENNARVLTPFERLQKISGPRSGENDRRGN